MFKELSRDHYEMKDMFITSLMNDTIHRDGLKEPRISNHLKSSIIDFISYEPPNQTLALVACSSFADIWHMNTTHHQLCW